MSNIENLFARLQAAAAAAGSIASTSVPEASSITRSPEDVDKKNDGETVEPLEVNGGRNKVSHTSSYGTISSN